MLQLTKDDIYLEQHAENKQEAIAKIAKALTDNQFVADGYVNGMQERETQAATYLGSGIAIPHGTTTTRDLVKKTGVQVFCFPNGVEWGDDGEKAYIAIGIAASSDEHLTLLRQLTHVLGDDDVEDRIKQIKTIDDAISLLTGQVASSDDFDVANDFILLDIESDDLSTMKALNASRLKQINAVNTAFITHALDAKPSYLGQGVWLNDSIDGNLKNAVAITRLKNKSQEDNLDVNMLITIAAKNDQLDELMSKLAALAYQQQLTLLHSASKDELLNILFSQLVTTGSQSDSVEKTVTKECIVLNTHGIHTRPASVLVKLIKTFNSKVTIANLDGTGTAVSATSLMKIVALGAKKGSKVQFVATGEDADVAIAEIEKAVNEGLGEEIA